MASDVNRDVNLRDWIGRTETVTDLIAPMPVAALNATLDRDDPAPESGDNLPALYHWMYFLGLARTSDLDVDGHPKRGGFLPPVALPRRMWAASDVTFAAPLMVGEEAVRTSVIEDVTEKQGRTGPLVFVKIRSEISGSQGLAIVDRQTVVYREDPPAVKGNPQPVPGGKPASNDDAYSRSIDPSAALLFRYSALIFNAHRIHYDLPYTRDVEGYPGLVVHGPLTATLLADLVRREHPGRTITAFRFRAQKPIFDNAPFMVCGRPEGDSGVALWAKDAAGDLCVEAEVELD